ncbi:Doublecortin [Oesophagostomum dentatum]|uniref:Doublecortin n=1 Tax=Oesophagostomum dentatum TaxID=61180 RepID=A0A0B1SLY4_OESDE|nr:Doublecortin [Oesophagostomum dentatum]
MAKVRSGSVRRNIDTSLSNSYSSSAASSLSSSNYGVKTVRVFKNGDPYHQGIKVVLNRRYVHDLDKLLELLSEKFDLTHGVKKLYTTNGKLIRHFQDIEDKQDYVAATNHFIPLFYGKWTNPNFTIVKQTTVRRTTPKTDIF